MVIPWQRITGLFPKCPSGFQRKTVPSAVHSGWDCPGAPPYQVLSESAAQEPPARPGPRCEQQRQANQRRQRLVAGLASHRTNSRPRNGKYLGFLKPQGSNPSQLTQDCTPLNQKHPLHLGLAPEPRCRSWNGWPLPGSPELRALGSKPSSPKSRFQI